MNGNPSPLEELLEKLDDDELDEEQMETQLEEIYLNVECIGDEDDGDDDDELLLDPQSLGQSMQVSRTPEEELLQAQVEEEQMTRVAIVWLVGLNVRRAVIS